MFNDEGGWINYGTSISDMLIHIKKWCGYMFIGIDMFIIYYQGLKANEKIGFF